MGREEERKGPWVLEVAGTSLGRAQRRWPVNHVLKFRELRSFKETKMGRIRLSDRQGMAAPAPEEGGSGRATEAALPPGQSVWQLRDRKG